MIWNPFERLTAEQQEQLQAYRKLLLEYNRMLNLISRSSEAAFEARHLLHSLALTQKSFPARSRVVDWGTGGGLPGIPLAICFPEARFTLVDSIGKKIRAVQEIVDRLGLKNVETWNGRAEAWTGSAHYAVSRATAPLLDLWQWYARVRKPLNVEIQESYWKQGLICLKGGDLSEEITRLHKKSPNLRVEQIPLQPLLGDLFEDKYIMVVGSPETA